MREDILNQFANWMRPNPRLSEVSVKKYRGAVNTISNEMLTRNVIHKALVNMNLVELDIAISNILIDEHFVRKNSVGDKMYSNALKQFRCFRYETVEPDPNDQITATDIVEKALVLNTEKQTIVKARIGQGKFRTDLIEKYDGKCVVSGIDIPQLLVASHIKPWAVCNNVERIDVENGLLLCSNLDKLFDSGLMTFSKKGDIIISSFVGKENIKRLHIEEYKNVDLRATERLKYYLEYHRDVLFVK